MCAWGGRFNICTAGRGDGIGVGERRLVAVELELVYHPFKTLA